MKKFATAVICALLVSSIPDATASALTVYVNPLRTDAIGMPSPFTECDSIEDAIKSAGFEISVPESLSDAYSKESIQTIKDTLIDINYKGTNSDLKVRKSIGLNDPSGDYRVYKEIISLTVNNNDVLLKGNDGKIYNAVWNDGEYSYSVSITSDTAGLEKSSIIDIINQIK